MVGFVQKNHHENHHYIFTMNNSPLFTIIHHYSWKIIHSSSIRHPLFTMNSNYHHYPPLFARWLVIINHSSSMKITIIHHEQFTIIHHYSSNMIRSSSIINMNSPWTSNIFTMNLTIGCFTPMNWLRTSINHPMTINPSSSIHQSPFVGFH